MSQPKPLLKRRLMEPAFEEGFRLFRDLSVWGRAVARDGTVYVWANGDHTLIIVDPWEFGTIASTDTPPSPEEERWYERQFERMGRGDLYRRKKAESKRR